MAGNSPELKWQKKLSVTSLKVLLRKKKNKAERKEAARCTRFKDVLVFYYVLNECDVNRLLPALLSTENTFYLAI